MKQKLKKRHNEAILPLIKAAQPVDIRILFHPKLNKAENYTILSICLQFCGNRRKALARQEIFSLYQSSLME